jgi:streptomycin 6-kinase
LPGLVAGCSERWSLSLGDPFTDAYTSLVVPATRADGSDVVLKVQVPDRESEHEAAALSVWDGNGAVRLLAHDPDRRALLLERCVPGGPCPD